MNQKIYDIAIIGGGINGMGVARDAAGRGHKVVLFEQNDFASATSSASSKLIHGGLRYLEYYEFSLVRAALKEREVLMKMAPHIIWPLDFKLPHAPKMRPIWLIRLGLFLYDHIGGRKILPKSKLIKLDPHKIKTDYPHGFSYADCWVDDSRLVALNAVDAAEHGAALYNYNPVRSVHCENGLWHIAAGADGGMQTICARKLVNAAGPWVYQLLKDNDLIKNETHRIRLVKGSHIVVPRIFDGTESYILQQEDGRIVFVLPFEDRYSIIGTTDVEYQGDASEVTIDQGEVAYLVEAANMYLQKPISADDIVSSYSGVRPLLDSGEDNASAVTRDYVLEYSEEDGAPLLNIFGGKITTYRVLAEKALDYLSDAPQWTANSVLPGGLQDCTQTAAIEAGLQKMLPDVDSIKLKALALRWARQYGSRYETILEAPSSGKHFGAYLYQMEVDYLLQHEFVQCADDVLWRRTKLGLHLSGDEVEALDAYIKQL